MSAQALLSSPVATLVAAALLALALGRAISRIRMSGQQHVVTHLRSQLTDTYKLVSELLLTFRNAGATFVFDADRATKVALQLDETAVLERLRSIFAQAPRRWNPGDRGYVEAFATPERLAAVFVTHSEYADVLYGYAKRWVGAHLALRKELRERLKKARDLTGTTSLIGGGSGGGNTSAAGELVGAARRNA